MLRQLLLALLLVAIVGVALFYGISGLPFIVLALSAALLSVLFVRTRAEEEREGSSPPAARPP